MIVVTVPSAFTFTLVFPSNPIRSDATALVPLTVNVNASLPVIAFVKFVFKFSALSDATTAVTIPVVSPRIIFASVADILPVIVTACVFPTMPIAFVTFTAFVPIFAASSVTVVIVSTPNVSTFSFNATISDASALVSVVVNVITSFTSTFPIAFNVSVTAPFVIVAVTTPLVVVAIVFVFAALIAPVITTASVPPVIVKACVTVAAFVPIVAASSVIVLILVTVKLSTFSFNATISDASALVSVVVNVITSAVFTFVIASNVAFTAPAVIVAVTTPLVAFAIVFTFVAAVTSSIVTFSSPRLAKLSLFVTYNVFKSTKFPVTDVAFTITSTLVLPSNAFKSIAVAVVPVTVNVKASVAVALAKFVFKLAALSAVITAVTIPLVPFTDSFRI